MILVQIATGSKNMLLGGISCRTPAKVIKLPTQEDLICFCDFVSSECDYEELAFADTANPEKDHNNDFKGILTTLMDPSSEYTFCLVDSAGEETELLDGVHGTLYAPGFNSLQPLKVGFKIDWLKVYKIEELGGGIYNIRIKQTDFGTETTADSHNIRLMHYSILASEGTVKVRTIQKGIHLNGDNFDGMEWENMNRIRGDFGNEEQQNEISRFKDGNYKDYDVQNDYYYKYTFGTNLLPAEIADLILNVDTKTDRIFIDNYSIYAYRQYEDLEVIAEGTVESSEDYSRNRNKRFTITFEDKQKNIKRNFT